MRAAILVPDPGFHEAWDWAYDVEADALRRAGIEVEPRAWTDPGNLTGFDLVTPLVAWGYHLDPLRWHTLLDQLEAADVTTLNPVALLRWNSDKSYLAELGAAGIATVPSRLVKALDDATIDEARRDFGDALVIKPPISASADGTYRIGPGDAIPDAARGRTMMIQPFLRSITTEGEYSVMLFGGRFSHCIVKRPKDGDYRVQPHLGGSEAPVAAPDGAIALAEAALGAAPADAAYSRVDMVRDKDGRLCIIELELIEPALWLQHAPDGGTSFAAAIVERARQ